MQHTIVITEALAGKRVDQLPISGVTRSFMAKNAIFKRGDQTYKPKTKTQLGDTWVIEFKEEKALSHITPWDTPLEILAESDSWAVINKPYGVSVHPSNSEKTNRTMVNALVHHYGTNLSEAEDTIDGTVVSKPGLVHRLDKTTSGVLLVAKTNQAHAYLQKHWKDVIKIYTAHVVGITPAKGRIEAGIKRDPRSKVKMVIGDDDKSKPALTTFEKTSSTDIVSHLRVQIHTGRTHQIRVHLSSIGFPIVGDKLYDGPETERIMLHSTEITFPDPDNNGEMRTVTSEIPFSTKRKQISSNPKGLHKIHY